MASNKEQESCEFVQTTEFASQSCEINEFLLMVYVGYIRDDVSKEEMLSSKPLETNTRGELIFVVVSICANRRAYGLHTMKKYYNMCY